MSSKNWSVADLAKKGLTSENGKDFKPSKYGNVKTVIDGIKFDSKKEAKRYGELMLMQKTKQIYGLKTQVKYDIVINDVKVCRYVADFTYKCANTDTLTTEDVKGFKTGIYRLKKKLMKAVFGIEILET